MIKIDCPVQTYAWGKVGEDSLVARLKRSGDENFSLSPEVTYAELWMGTHSSGPSTVAATGELLSEWLNSHPNMVGQVPESYPTNDLPFLFKILSINTALSIQAHPDKELAKILHHKFPLIYRDPNHKPEMVLALTPFECLCGFRSVPEILHNLESFPEFSQLLQSTGFHAEKFHDLIEDSAAFVRSLFDHYMQVGVELSCKLQQDLVTRLNSQSNTSKLEDLIIKLSVQYPNDNGIFAPLVLNFLELKCGDSFFIEANEPHAYISGDCIECMALSDNVVRAGLTPKLKDVDVLRQMLTYRTGPPSFLTPQQLSDNTLLYRPPQSSCAEFELERIDVPSCCTVEFHTIPCASIILFLNGSGAMNTLGEEAAAEFHEGEVYLLGANKTTSITNKTGTNVLAFRAHINLD